MDDETAIGGADGRFPETRRSLLVSARSSDRSVRRSAYETLITGYWKPIYKHLRVRWSRSNEDAKDLTQEFLVMAVDKEILSGYDDRMARLRTYLRTCVDRFVQNQDRDAARLKRGGGVVHLSLDFEGAEAELRSLGSVEPEDVFEREWLRSLLATAVETLEADCRVRGREIDFQLFERYDLHDEDDGETPTYADLAARFELPVTTVTNRLATVRRRFRALALETLREMTGSDEEYEREARDLFGLGRA